jgi:hypothetical protein
MTPHTSMYSKILLIAWAEITKIFEEIGDEKSLIIAQFKKIGLISENIKYLVNSNLYFDRAVENQFLTKVSFLVSKRDV